MQGAADITYNMSPEPLESEESGDAWLEAQREQFGPDGSMTQGGDKHSETVEDLFLWNGA